MSTHYRLVYMLATKTLNDKFEPIIEHGEFGNRSAAREYVKNKTFEEEIFLVRKEVAIFFDGKLVDKED